MPQLELPPWVKRKIRERPKKTGYGAPPKPGKGKPAGYGKPSGAEIPGIQPYPKAGKALANTLKKPVSSPIPVAEARLGIPSRFIIEGKRATDLEWRVWKSLLKLGWPQSEIDFQVDVLGGHMPGGFLLDFVVWTPGMVSIVEPDGDYWHVNTPEKIQKDRQRIEKLQQIWAKPFRYFHFGQAIANFDDATYHYLLLNIGRY